MASTRPASFRDALGLLSGTVLLGLAERLGERFLPLYLVQLGGGTAVIGSFQAASNLVGAAAAVPGGYLSDRLGTRRALQAFAGAAALGFLMLMLARTWPLAFAGALIALSWSAVSLPAALVLITRAVRTTNTAWGVSLHSVVRRIPMALGPLFAGMLMTGYGEERGLRLAFTIALVLAIATAFVQQVMIRDAGTVAATTASRGGGFRPLAALRAMSPPLRELFVADTLIRFCEQIPYAFVVLWCMREIAAPVTALQFGQLTAIEMVAATLAYAPGAWLSGRIGKPAAVALTFVFFVMFPLVLLVSHSFGMLVVAFAIRGFKELGEPTRKSLILDLCPEESRATWFGWYYFCRDTLAAVAAALGAWLWSRSPESALLAAAGFGVAGLAGYALRGVRPPRPAAGS